MSDNAMMSDSAAGRSQGSSVTNMGVMPETSLQLLLPDAEATETLGAALARCYLAGPPGATVFFRGELGAGKTTCVRSLLRTLGVTGLIRSPTYTLVETYTPRGLTCVHVDLFRLEGPALVDELGLRDYLAGDCLLMVEWPQNGAAALPVPDLDIDLHYAGDGRRARVSAATPRGRVWHAILSSDTSLISYLSNLT
jgi:tRNA threonylcarbamoyladenosine biosynthesis protein TsaE